MYLSSIMLAKKQSIIALFSILIICVISGFLYKNYTKTRDGLIVEVPIEAFDNNGILIDENWKRYLIERKPVGVILLISPRSALTYCIVTVLLGVAVS